MAVGVSEYYFLYEIYREVLQINSGKTYREHNYISSEAALWCRSVFIGA